MVVPGTVVQESRQRKRIAPTIPTLGREVLGQYRRVLGQYSLGTVQSWESGLGTVPGSLPWDSTESWDSTVLGQ